MKIQQLELFKVPPRWLFLKLTTSSGITGWGEPVLEGRTDSVAGAVMDLKEYIIGHDASRIEDLFNVLSKGGFYRGGAVLMSAISGIEQALWDIKGKALDTPVYNLMGGAVRDKVRVYGWIGGDTPDELLENAEERIKAGYTALKMNASGKMEWLTTPGDIKIIKNNIAELRRSIGDVINIGLDFHGRIHKSAIKALLSELEEFHPMFYEEPVLPEFTDQLREISAYTTIPIALGERLIARSEFKKLISEGIVDIIQPDISHAGGIWETRKIAAMAEASDIAIAPHCAIGPIAFAAALQLNTCTPNAVIQESSLGIHYNEGYDLMDYITNKDDFKMKDGFISNLSRPGLGVEINEVFVSEMSKVGHNWRNPLWRAEDGSLLEW
jgi:galactonate dehydratase